MGSRAKRTHGKAAAGGTGKVAAGGTGIPYVHADKPGGTTREQDRPHNPGLQQGEI